LRQVEIAYIPCAMFAIQFGHMLPRVLPGFRSNIPKLQLPEQRCATLRFAT
jgi:hypothetical protein